VAASPKQILDESSAAVAALEAQQWRASTEKSLEYAHSLSTKVAVTLAGGHSCFFLLALDVGVRPVCGMGGMAWHGMGLSLWVQACGLP
jgi:hypothetical protein